MINDPISDMLTRIRNSNIKLYKEVLFPFSKLKFSILEKMKNSGYLSEVWVTKNGRDIKAKIKFFNKNSLINNLVRVSKPSQRIYLTTKEIKKKCIGKKTYFISTSNGILTHKESINKKIGGELMFFIS